MMNKNKSLGCMFMTLGLCYCPMETIHYGNHWMPSCDGEVIADGISIIICAISSLIMTQKN